MKPWLQKTAKEFEGKVKFVAIDVDAAPDLAESYSVEGYPTFVIVKGGAEVGRIAGTDKEMILDLIDSAF